MRILTRERISFSRPRSRVEMRKIWVSLSRTVDNVLVGEVGRYFRRLNFYVLLLLCFCSPAAEQKDNNGYFVLTKGQCSSIAPAQQMGHAALWAFPVQAPLPHWEVSAASDWRTGLHEEFPGARSCGIPAGRWPLTQDGSTHVWPLNTPRGPPATSS
ncbi:hypothetical protein F5B20DRAFT_375258 [Whalleya microplaca]|nr:hypothetical protein F5B20DRAFT_375258 [Whalleya microplaca]